MRCPVLVIHGTDDRIRPHTVGARLAELTGGSLVLLEDSGHAPLARSPVEVNLLIKEFADRVYPPVVSRRLPRPLSRRPRALYLSSPIGLGHARRDLAIATELRAAAPGPGDRLAGPASGHTLLDPARVHPASAWLANESSHVEHEAGEHDLHAFQAIRRMDAILVRNFMVFNEVVESERYDLVIGDEAWDLDYFLHENPRLKRFAFAWLTDFVGWLPMPDGGKREAAADGRLQRGDARAASAAAAGAGPVDLRRRRGRRRADVVRRRAARDSRVDGRQLRLRRLRHGFRRRRSSRSARRCGIGSAAVRTSCSAWSRSAARGSANPCCAGCSTRCRSRSGRCRDCASSSSRGRASTRDRCRSRPGVTVRGYVPDLHRVLAACDLAVVQGGLTTCMELTAAGRPFVYVPLRHHFEQNYHVRHRLDRYGAGHCLPYEEAADPDVLATTIAKEAGRTVAYRPVETDGAARAAGLLSALL